MVCRRCSKDIPSQTIRGDTFDCPYCGYRYFKKVSANSTALRQRQHAKVQEQQHQTANRAQQERIGKRNRIYLLSGAALALTAIIVIIVAISGRAPAKSPLDAASIVAALSDSGLPVSNIVTYDANTDPNGLLGRPNSYTSKSSFADSRLVQIGDEPVGGTVEVFATAADAKKRHEYVSSFNGTILGSFCYFQDNAVMRLDYDLTPEQADAYNNAFESIVTGK